MKTAIITIGVSASGKTTWAKEYIQKVFDEFDEIWTIVCRDDIRQMIYTDETQDLDFTWNKWDFKKEKDVTKKQYEIIEDLSKKSSVRGIIVADTNLNKAYLENLEEHLTKCGFKIKYEYFPIAFEAAVQRDIQRRNPVGPFIIARQMEKWYRFVENKIPQYDDRKTDAVLCDIDGTLAINSGNRSFYDYSSKMLEDELCKPVKAALNGLREDGNTIIIVSGREATAESVSNTRAWLEKHEIQYHKLFMRQEKNYESDVVIKERILKEYILPNHNVTAVFDDRPKVVRMWQSYGFVTFSLGNQWIEF